MMKRKWLIFSCLGLIFLGLVALLIIGSIIFSAFKDLAQEEFSELNSAPREEAPPISYTTENPPQAREISDISYIKTFAVGYSDDSDPQDEGIAIDVFFYDSRSDLLRFSNVPFVLVIELYGYRDIHNLDQSKAELVYRGSLSLDHSMRLGEMMGHYVRIPFDEISVDQSTYQPFGTLKIIVETTMQGHFEAQMNPLPLYEYGD